MKDYEERKKEIFDNICYKMKDGHITGLTSGGIDKLSQLERQDMKDRIKEKIQGEEIVFADTKAEKADAKSYNRAIYDILKIIDEIK